MLHLYENIKNRRKELQMTQDELAKKLGYSDKSMISKIERGEVDLPQSKIMAFADALSISAADLMGWEDPDPSYYLQPEVEQMVKELDARPELKVLFDASRKLTKEDVEAVIRLIKR